METFSDTVPTNWVVSEDESFSHSDAYHLCSPDRPGATLCGLFMLHHWDVALIPSSKIKDHSGNWASLPGGLCSSCTDTAAELVG